MDALSLSEAFQKTPLVGLEHRLLKRLQQEPDLSSVGLCIVAVSGGLDSVALLASLFRLRRLLGFGLVVAHVHHGNAPDEPQQVAFRNEAWQFVSALSQSLELPFFSNRSPRESGEKLSWVREPRQVLQSEDDFRSFRYSVLEEIAHHLAVVEQKKVVIALAHTANDQLETRMIQMARGSGIHGFLGMNLFSQLKLRPFIDYTREQLEDYAQTLELQWREDPSNQSLDPLRNWMRQKWFPQLDQKRPGSVANLARSFQLIAEQLEHQEPDWTDYLVGGAVDRQRFLELGRQQQAQLLAYYMRQMGLKGYGQSHVEELLKRLDTPRKELSFQLLKRLWRVSHDRIQVCRV